MTRHIHYDEVVGYNHIIDINNDGKPLSLLMLKIMVPAMLTMMMMMMMMMMIVVIMIIMVVIITLIMMTIALLNRVP